MNCYVMVGGRSRRMGSSKAELFLERIVAATRPLFDEVTAVQRIDGEPLPIRTIFEEPHEDEGPIFGLARALADARRECFILGVDYPLVTSDLLRFLIDRFAASAAPAVVPEWGSHPQPLCAAYDGSLLPLVEKRIASGLYDLRGLIAEAEAEIVAEDELRDRFPGEPLMNVNTPEELEEAVRLYAIP